MSRPEGAHPYSYLVSIRSIGIEAPLWSWQIDLEEGNGVLDFGQAHSRRQAVRQGHTKDTTSQPTNSQRAAIRLASQWLITPIELTEYVDFVTRI